MGITKISVIRTLMHAFHTVFSQKKYILLSLIVAATMLGIITLLPVGRFSEKAFYYQITSLDKGSLFTMVLFSCILGILFSFNLYVFKKKQEAHQKVARRGIIALAASFIAGVFGSTVCLACVSLLFGFLGLPTIAFLLAYQKEFFVLSAFISFISLYLSAKAIESYETCEVCHV